LLELIEKEKPEKKIFLQKMILRTLTQASYSNLNVGHFGL
jgi:exoribonuclease R